MDINILNRMFDPYMSTQKDAINNIALKEQFDNFIELKSREFLSLKTKEAAARLISEENWLNRNQVKSCEQLGVRVRIGDICYIDFGQAYLNEAGFQHFGIILSFCNGKAFVTPMTSNQATYKQAFDPLHYPLGKKHLMRLGLIEGLNKESVLFLNDSKYINTARIIDVKAHIGENSPLFQEIKNRIKSCLVF